MDGRPRASAPPTRAAEARDAELLHRHHPRVRGVSEPGDRALARPPGAWDTRPRPTGDRRRGRRGRRADAVRDVPEHGRQAWLFAQGVTRLRDVGTHHYGLACDLLRVEAGIPRWNGDYAFLRALARRHGLDRGGDRGRPDLPNDFVDAAHVQRCAFARQPHLFAGEWHPDEAYDPYEDRGGPPSPVRRPPRSRGTSAARGGVRAERRDGAIRNARGAGSGSVWPYGTTRRIVGPPEPRSGRRVSSARPGVPIPTPPGPATGRPPAPGTARTRAPSRASPPRVRIARTPDGDTRPTIRARRSRSPRSSPRW